MSIVTKSVSAQLGKQSLVSSCASISSELSCTQESDGTGVVLPALYKKEKSYPVLITLPFTGGTPADYIQGSFTEQYKGRTSNPFIIILLPVEGSEDDWKLPGHFPIAIKRYESLVKSRLSDLIPKYNIDKSRIVLAGSSLGGDLSWALSLRNPGFFCGTIVINSQSTYRDDSAMRQLAANKSRFVMIISEADQKDRLKEIRLAVDELARYGVSHRFEIIPGMDYDAGYDASSIRSELLLQSVDDVLFGQRNFR